MTRATRSAATPVDVDALWRARPRSRLVRLSWIGIAALVVWAWSSRDFDWADLFAQRRVENVRRFLASEVTPYPLRESGFSWSALWSWTSGLWSERGAQGTLATLCMAVLAISLAALLATLFAPFAARNLMAARPFEFSVSRARMRSSIEERQHRRLAWRALASGVRAFLILLRAIPEYVWAYLLLAMLGPSAWPAVLALAIHNSGILGKLGAETIENLEARPLVAWHGLGATRAQVWLGAVLPLALSRFLLYFFYRFETCVREATVLGMLGVASLGYWIQDARAKHFYDEMLFFVLLGAAIVLLGDLVSALARAALRRAA